MNYELMSVFDKEIKYKDLTFYPIRMYQYFEFMTFAQILNLEKDYIPNEYKGSKEKMLEYVKIMQMNDLDFLFATSNKENARIAFLHEILRLCLKREDLQAKYTWDSNHNAIFTIDNHNYNNDDYIEIKQIISSQNSFDLLDVRKSKEFRDIEARSIEMRRKSMKSAGLEEIMLSLSLFGGLKLEDVYNMTIRKFNMAIDRANLLLHYPVYLGASMNGMVEFKDKSFIKHWLSNIEKDNGAFVSLDSVSGKMKTH